MEKTTAPFKRGTLLDYTGAHFPHGQVKYVKWWGFARAALIVVQLQDGRKVTVHVSEVKPS